MNKVKWLIFIATMVALSSCGRSSTENGADQTDLNNPLEMAARERGIIREQASELTGVFERRHDLGRDALCVVPAGEDKWRFALTASFGPGLSCNGRGQITRIGDRWRLSFTGADGCDVVLREQEDELRFPGNLPQQCSKLCPSRASLAGLRLPRASWTVTDARRLQMKSRSGNTVQPCAS